MASYSMALNFLLIYSMFLSRSPQMMGECAENEGNLLAMALVTPLKNLSWAYAVTRCLAVIDFDLILP